MGMKTLAERLRWAREKRGLSGAALDAEAAIASGHVAKIERGNPESPSSTTIIKIAKALKVDASWLMFGSGPKPQIERVGQ